MQPHVFYSGDAGLKFMAIKQICASEDFRYITDTHAEWVKDIWAHGYFPIQPPFAIHNAQGYLFQYPPAFQFISAFFYQRFGFAGLYLIPFISLLLLWFWFIRMAQKLDFSPAQTAIVFFLLAFCSPLTFYGAVYWEHTLAMLLLFSGIYFLMYEPKNPWLAGLLGLASGLAVWLRPESMLINILLIAAIALIHLRQLKMIYGIFAFGVLAGTASFLLFNKAEYGFFFGMHGLQVLENKDHLSKFRQVLSNIYHINLLLIQYFSIVLLLIPILFAWLKFKWPLSTRILVLIGVVFIYCFFSPFMFPNDGLIGGKQWGPRFYLPIMPIVILILADTWRLWRSIDMGRYKKPMVVVAVLAIGCSFVINTFVEADTLRDENLHRIRPALDFVKEDQDQAIVINSHYVTMELADLFRGKNFFLAEDTGSFRKLMPLLKSEGVDRFLYVNSAALPDGFSNVLSEYQVKLMKKGDYRIGYFTKY